MLKKDFQILFNKKLFPSHCSGHLMGSDILELVKEIGAKTVYQVHTKRPKMYSKKYLTIEY